MEISKLQQLGLTKNEAKLYLAALEFGPATIAHLAKKSNVQRTTIYEFIEQMINKGIIIKTVSGKRNLYASASPKYLENLIEKQKSIIKSLMPELLSLAEKSPHKPIIRVFEGIDGIKKVFQDTLNQPPESVIKYFASYKESFEAMSTTYMTNYVNRRVKNRIYSKGILRSDEYEKKHTKENKKELRESISLPEKEFPITHNVMIYQNKISIISFGQEKFSVILESQQIADSQRAIFDLLWKNLKKK
jgi:HTH-type transcriptional regulator, sugar sensing transcriptional regulator